MLARVLTHFCVAEFAMRAVIFTIRLIITILSKRPCWTILQILPLYSPAIFACLAFRRPRLNMEMELSIGSLISLRCTLVTIQWRVKTSGTDWNLEYINRSHFNCQRLPRTCTISVTYFKATSFWDSIPYSQNTAPVNHKVSQSR